MNARKYHTSSSTGRRDRAFTRSSLLLFKRSSITRAWASIVSNESVVWSLDALLGLTPPW